MSKYQPIAELALDDLRRRSKSRIYQTDPQAWVADVLDKGWWSKQQEVAQSFIDGPRTAVKSSNGTGKSHLVADLICWWVSVFPPDETLAIISAPTISQIEKVVFAGLKLNYAQAQKNGHPLIGEISEQLTWKFANPETGKKEFLAFGKKPSDGSDIVSTFQGTRKLRTAVFLDEAGGVPRDLYTAAEAVATGEHAKTMAIGNPDRLGTEFHKIFTDPRMMAEWSLHTISSFDLPSFTGEVVYQDSERQDRFLKSLTSQDWVEHKRRAWGEGDARWMSKVLGEFPGEADNTFFGQHIIDKAIDTTIEEDLSIRPVLGVDIARWGEDESVVYVNRGGRVRIHPDGVWSKCDTLDSSRNIHRIAQSVGAGEVRVDSAGIGGAVFDMLDRLDEFANKQYTLIGINGSNSSPDLMRWDRIKSYNHDYLRQQMLEGKVDLDYDDKELKDELIAITFNFNNRGAIQITKKDDMRKALGKSPDRLDAVIYAVADVDALLHEEPKQSIAVYDPDDFTMEYSDMRGMPV